MVNKCTSVNGGATTSESLRTRTLSPTFIRTRVKWTVRTTRILCPPAPTWCMLLPCTGASAQMWKAVASTAQSPLTPLKNACFSGQQRYWCRRRFTTISCHNKSKVNSFHQQGAVTNGMCFYVVEFFKSLYGIMPYIKLVRFLASSI